MPLATKVGEKENQLNQIRFSANRIFAIFDFGVIASFSPTLLTSSLSHNWTSSGPAVAVSGTCKRFAQTLPTSALYTSIP